ncbi:MAG: TonB-dependent receptor [Deltaproteobacteria bacterium]|nr:TonB-dependent receptor [Deltaproteobacteria bacterium]
MFERDPRQNPVPNDLFSVQRFSAAVAHTWTPSSALQLRTIAYGYTTTRDWDFQRYDRSPQPNPSVPLDQQISGPPLLYERIVGDQSTPGGAIFLRDESLSSDRAYQVFGVEPRLRARFRTGPFRHDLDVGGRVLHENSVVRVLLGRGALSRSGELATEQERNGTAIAAFVQERLFITERLNLVPGVRVESYFSDIVQRRDQGVDLDRRSNSQLVEVIPGVSASYQWPAVTLFGGMHRGYAPPRILPTINSSARDQLLAAEESVNYEAGARISVGNWLRAESTGFLMDFSNETVQVSGEDTEFASIGKTRHAGVEAAVQLDFGRALRWPTSVFLGLRYTFVDARVGRPCLRRRCAAPRGRQPRALLGAPHHDDHRRLRDPVGAHRAGVVDVREPTLHRRRQPRRAQRGRALRADLVVPDGGPRGALHAPAHGPRRVAHGEEPPRVFHRLARYPQRLHRLALPGGHLPRRLRPDHARPPVDALIPAA